MAGELVVALVTAVVTSILVVVTWNYARSSQSIAHETASAARYARDAAQINLLQAILAVQPLLEISSIDVEYVSSSTHAGSEGRTPVRITWSVANLGRGLAFDPQCRAELAGHVLLQKEDVSLPIGLAPSEQVHIEHTLRHEAWSAASRYLGTSEADVVGKLTTTCHDAFGGRVYCEVPLLVRNGSLRRGSPLRKYDDSEDVRARLQRLFGRVLND